jgi:transposase InsO family protein
MPRSTVACILKRAGLPRLRDLEPPEPVIRYEREQPGELVHLDIKKLGRFGVPGKRVTGDKRRGSRGYGWEHVHVCIDDASRLAYVEVLGDEKGETAAAFLRRAARWFHRYRIRFERVMTDNGAGYKSHAFRDACEELGARHLFTRPYRPCTNGKAERFIQTLLREWAYVARYRSSNHRKRVLPEWLWHYNRERPHASLGGKTPIQRIRRSG